MSEKGRNAQSLRLWKRKGGAGVFHMRFPGGTWQSTGCTNRKSAEARAISRLGVLEYAAVSGRPAVRKADLAGSGKTLRQYTEGFFEWEPGKPPACPWCAAKLAEGKQIGPEHAQRQQTAAIGWGRY